MNTNTATLPQNVACNFAAINRFDAEAAADCFTPDATVHDEGKTHVGTEAIRNWVAHTSEEYRSHATVTGAEQKGEKMAVAASVAGQFPGSPVELEFQFSLRGEKIAELSVH